MKLWNKLLQNPYVLALLIGVYPIAFYITNNWFMFEASRSLFIFGTFSLIVFMIMGSFYLALSWFIKKMSRNNHSAMMQRIFILVSILALGYLLRHTLSQMIENKLHLGLIIGLTAAVIGWLTPAKPIFHINIILVILCLVNLVNGIYSILTAETTAYGGKHENTLQQSIENEVAFSKKPNVYYIVPDGYPSREALKKVYDLDNKIFYKQLESSGFTLYHSAFSNYMNTLASIGASFDMAHHYYRGNVGSFEILHSRKFIVSEQNPVVRTFKRNGYQVHFVHQVEYMFTRGCFIDFCYPNVFWGNLVDILMPWQLKDALGLAVDQTLHAFEQRLLHHIDRTSQKDEPHFLYVHILMPAHSNWQEQTPDDLRVHRKGFSKKIQLTNEAVNNIIQRIIKHDPTALIMINADHGSWGLGVSNIVDSDLHEGLLDDLIAIDHLGVLLAIRWPNGPPKYHKRLRTNVNLFRYIFAYLTQSEKILKTKTPDDGYILKGKKGKKSTVTKVVKDGKTLIYMRELEHIDYHFPL